MHCFITLCAAFFAEPRPLFLTLPRRAATRSCMSTAAFRPAQVLARRRSIAVLRGGHAVSALYPSPLIRDASMTPATLPNLALVRKSMKLHGYLEAMSSPVGAGTRVPHRHIASSCAQRRTERLQFRSSHYHCFFINPCRKAALAAQFSPQAHFSLASWESRPGQASPRSQS
jgi:hypothetical protein